MAKTPSREIEIARAAFIEGYEACFKRRALAAAGFDTKDADEAWQASKTYRRLTRGDGGPREH